MNGRDAPSAWCAVVWLELNKDRLRALVLVHVGNKGLKPQELPAQVCP
jgi:hypothetical protein